MTRPDSSVTTFFSFAKCSCRFGSDCRYVHDSNVKPTNTPTARIINNTIDELLAKLLDILGLNNSSPTASNMSQPLTTLISQPVALNTSGPIPYISGPVGYHPTQLSQPFVSPPPAQPHLLPQPTYTTQQVQSGLTGSTVSLGQATVNCTIEFDAFGFSVKDFLKRRVLLRCDSTGDLYPVIAPSPIPRAFLVSQHTWHQRLGHPGLGKHVRLPFNSSGTVISSSFDVIHSDVWTSPIPSLSGFKGAFGLLMGSELNLDLIGFKADDDVVSILKLATMPDGYGGGCLDAICKGSFTDPNSCACARQSYLVWAKLWIWAELC
nr:ribonuclease H-like domain-containing protein [Tanacetum cinerariifolium]